MVVLFMFIVEETALKRQCLISWRTLKLCKRMEVLL